MTLNGRYYKRNMKKRLILNNRCMKYILSFFVALAPVLWVSAQTKKDSCCLAQKDLEGVWQRDQQGVGNGLEQNVRFYPDQSFFLDMSSNDGEDARGIVSLQGKYRLVKNKLYLTVLARGVVQGGKVVMLNQQESTSIFGIEAGTVKLINEVNPKEMPVPLRISFLQEGGIMLGSETYYKLSKEDMKMAGIEWKK